MKMKVQHNAAVLLGISATIMTMAAATCDICPNGISPNENVDLADTSECESSINLHADLTYDGSDSCIQGKIRLVPLCCPAEPEDPCTICADGITVEGEVNIDTCESMLLLNANFEEGSQMCEIAKSEFEWFCCGSNEQTLSMPTEEAEPGTFELCSGICPDGINADGFTRDVETVASCIKDFKYFTSLPADDSACSASASSFQSAQYRCCRDALDQCSICPDGLYINENYPNSHGLFSDETDYVTQCEEKIAAYSSYPATNELCPKEKYEAACCPTPPENPCLICPDGVEIDKNNCDDTYPLDPGSDLDFAAQCEKEIAIQSLYDVDSNLCYKRMYERVCCPSPSEKKTPSEPCPSQIEEQSDSAGEMTQLSPLLLLATGFLLVLEI